MKKLDVIFFKTPNRNFCFFNYQTPCECGCDERGLVENERLIGYWITSIFGILNFTIFLKEFHNE